MISEHQGDSWKPTTLERCGRWISGGTPSRDRSDFWNGTVPWISAKSMNCIRLSDSKERVTLLGAENGARFAPKGSILILVRGSMLHQRIPIGITTKDVTFNQDVKAIVPASDVLPEFLLYWLLSNESKLLEMVEFTGIGAGKLSTDLLYNMEVKLPSLPEQRAIARILGSLDDKIELNRRMNETLEALARTLFKSWFVDFDPVRAKAEGREPVGMDAETAALFPDSLEDSLSGEIPLGWQINSIKSRASRIQYGLTQSASIDPIGPRFLRITDIKGGKVDWRQVPYCEVSKEDHEKYRIRDGDIFIARTGASTGDNIYIIDPPDSIFASYLVRFQFEDPAIARLVGEFMETPTYFEYVAGCIGGSAQPNASAQLLADAQLVFPTDKIAHRYYQILRSVDRKCAANSFECDTIMKIRDILLPKLLSGELRVDDNGTQEGAIT